jgi:hypothetical protein
MSFIEAIESFFGSAHGQFLSLETTILASFAFVEKYSSKDDLENYYLILTVKRNLSVEWYASLIRFFDLLFAFHKRGARIALPSLMRVAFYTLVTTSLMRGLYDVEVLVFSLAFAIIGNFFFDYVNLPRRGSY